MIGANAVMDAMTFKPDNDDAQMEMLWKRLRQR